MKGGGQVKEQTINVVLGPQRPTYEMEVPSASGEPKYKLLLRHNSIGQFPYEYWGVELREIQPRKKRLKPSLGDNTVSAERPGKLGDNFPREDYAGYLYPIDAAEEFLSLGPHHLPFYAIGAKRVIKVDGFYLIIKVNGYKFSEKYSGKVDSMDVTLELKNSYEPETQVSTSGASQHPNQPD